jgi:polar amino acid transport system substrate-binding protein
MKVSRFRGLSSMIAAIGIGFFSASVYAKTELPAVPDFIKSGPTLKIGVRCDQPPYGFKDNTGKFAGVEVEMARQIATWALGSPDKAELTCVTASNRIPLLVGKKVDLLIATLGITRERAKVIDFSNIYRWGNSDLLVLKNGPIHKLDDVAGRKVIMLKGSTQAQWFDAHMPKVETLRLDTVSDSVQSLKQGRGDAVAADAATLIVIASKDPGVRMVGEKFAVAETVAGFRKNEPAWRAYVNAALARMKEEHLFLGWVKQWVSPDVQSYYIDVFTKAKPVGR